MGANACVCCGGALELDRTKPCPYCGVIPEKVPAIASLLTQSSAALEALRGMVKAAQARVAELINNPGVRRFEAVRWQNQSIINSARSNVSGFNFILERMDEYILATDVPLQLWSNVAQYLKKFRESEEALTRYAEYV